MKCLACDRILNDFEATRRYQGSGEFIDLCNKCFHSGVSDDLNFSEREDLQEYEDVAEDEKGYN